MIPENDESRCLVWAVDDSPLERAGLSLALAHRFTVESFGDGSEMIERLSVGDPLPDALIVDWYMPGMSGLEICEFVRARFDATAMPVLVLTAKAAREDMLAGFAAGANDYVTKPFDAAELIARLSGLTQIKRMRDQVRREAEFRERFIGILGHDLRQPLNTFVIGSHTLLETALLPEQAQTVRRLKNAATRMNRMVADVLDLTRSRAIGLEIDPVPMDLAPVCRDIVDETRAADPGRPIQFTTSGDTAGDWDADRMAQVCTNLVGNAVEHGRAGGPIDVTLSGGSDGIVLRVENQGDAIPPQVLASIFEPFQRGQSTNARGLGLGLFIVDQIVRAHGGTVSVTSVDGITCFEVRLPRSSEGSGRVFGSPDSSRRSRSPSPQSGSAA